MVTLDALWLPIVLSAVVVFVASSLVWMVLPHHKNDARALPQEADVLQALRKAGVTRGLYRFPFAAGWDDMKTDAFKEKIKQGPVGLLTVMPADPFNMTKPMALWFVFLLVIGTFVAYLAGHTLAVGAHYLAVFRVVGTTAVLAYAAAHVPGAIWWGRPWSVTLKEIADGVVYGLLTAGVFGWLWPR